MVGHGGVKNEPDPEELLQRKFRAKCLFRALGRIVMANAHWLIEGIDHYEGLEDVNRRVEQAVRSKAKKKHLLSIHDKTILNKPAEERTEQEKKYLYRIIGGLKCFKRYPNNVKRKLAAVTYFKYYGPGRTIVRQHHEAHAMYFIVSGNVVVSQMIFDELLKQYVSVDIGVMHSGDMFGEVSLLHNIPRTATVTTTDHCELLALMREDFKNILQVSVQKQWDEVRRAMSAFTYFDSLDEVSRREGCIVAKIKSYTRNETLLGDGEGVANFVYFVLSGKCQMIESMHVIVSTHLGHTNYTLYDPHLSTEESERDFEAKYFGDLMNKESLASKPATSSVNETSEKITKLVRESVQYGEIEYMSHSAFKEEKRHNFVKAENTETVVYEANPPVIETTESMLSENMMDLLVQKYDRPTDYDHMLESTRLSLPSTLPHGSLGNLHTYFMQVCQFFPGSTFGFGEKMRDRRIVALTPVTCLLLPQVWLLQRNTANIWTRIKHYLDKTILTKKQLFDEFLAAMRWTEYREKVVADIVSRSKTVNSTSIHDVPYSIRTEEMLNI